MSKLSILERRVVQAHQDNDYPLLIELYEHGGDLWLQKKRIDESCFCWTNAYVFALEQGMDEKAQSLAAKLKEYGAL